MTANEPSSRLLLLFPMDNLPLLPSPFSRRTAPVSPGPQARSLPARGAGPSRAAGPVSPSGKPRRGFTLIELLTVIAIIGILAALITSAIFAVTGAANRARNESNAVRLRAAIVEYWHDMGHWPIPSLQDARKNLVFRRVSGSQLQGAAAAHAQTFYSYTMKFSTDNGEVVGELLDADFQGTKKDFLDLHGFATTIVERPGDNDWPVEGTVDAWLAHEGLAVDEETGKNLSKRDAPVLVYRSDLYKCPHCKEYFIRARCTNTDCPYYRNNGSGYRISEAEKVSAAKPYVITFDLKNNTVSVTTP